MVPKSISWTIGGGPISDASAPSDPPNSVDPTQDKDQDTPLPVPSSPADGQGPAVVPLGDMEGDKDKDKDKDNDKDSKLVEGDKKTASRKSKRIRSPNKELFPLKQPANKKVKTAKNQNEHVSVKYQTTRRINIGKHINHITKKKKNKICIDCKKMEVEECWMCGKEEHVCEMALPKTQVDYEWLWVCLECHEIVTDSVALINLREAVKDEKEKRKTKEPTYPCKVCSHLIYKNRRAIKCVECQSWLHLKCAGLKDHAEAKAVEDIFKCKKCNETTDREKIILGYKGISLRKSDIESLGPGRWLNDTIMSFGVQKLLSEYDCGTIKTKLVDPTMT